MTLTDSYSNNHATTAVKAQRRSDHSSSSSNNIEQRKQAKAKRASSFKVQDTRRSIASVPRGQQASSLLSHRVDLPGDFQTHQVRKARYDKKLEAHERNVEEFDKTKSNGETHQKFLLALLGEARAHLEAERRALICDAAENAECSSCSGSPLKLLRSRRSSSEKLKQFAANLAAAQSVSQCAKTVLRRYFECEQEGLLEAKRINSETSSTESHYFLNAEAASPKVVFVEDPYPELSRHIASYRFFGSPQHRGKTAEKSDSIVGGLVKHH